MQYVELILFEILLGYVLQSAGSIVCLYAFSGKKIEPKMFTLLTAVNAAAVYAIRHISIITFGIHTLLIMIVIIVLGLFVLRTSINASALSALITMVTVTVGEAVNFLILNLILDEATLKYLLDTKNSPDLGAQINKAIAVIPSNIFFIVVMFAIYYYSRKRMKVKKVGETGEANSQ